MPLLLIQLLAWKDLNSLGRNISTSPQHTSNDLTIELVRTGLGHSKVWDLGPEIMVQQNVAALEIPVDDCWGCVLMQELEASGAVQSDSETSRPVKWFVMLIARRRV